MGRERDAAKWDRWRRRLRDFERGQKTVAEFCRQAGVSVAAFYEWRRKLTPAVSGASQPRATVTERAPERRQVPEPLRFLPVEISPSAAVEALLPSGARLSIPGQDHAALRIVVTALIGEHGEDRPC